MNSLPTTRRIPGPAIHVQGLEKAYKDLPVLRGVDLDVAPGGILALLGSNGAGKTTMVKILSTLLKADAGTARVNGFDVATQAADVEGERDGWILVAARWPDRLREIMPAKHAQLDDPQLVRLYRLLSEILDSDADDGDPRAEEAADIMAGLAERAFTSGEINLGDPAHDDLPSDLLDALAAESDPRAQRMLDLMRERGWASWTRTRPERLAEPPD